jgi:hypothetical protein
VMLVGDINISSIKKIWNSDILNEYRAKLKNNKHDEIELCRNCFVFKGQLFSKYIPESI